VTKVQCESFREVTMKRNEASDRFSVFKSGVLYIWEGCLPTKHTGDICITSKSYFLCRCSTASTGKYAGKLVKHLIWRNEFVLINGLRVEKY
jgi:hypothetical protein